MVSDSKTTTRLAKAGLRLPVTRRRLLKTGGALAAASTALSMPYVFSRASAADPLVFWEFYSGGGNEAQAQWFNDMVDAWNAQSDTKIQLNYIPGSSEEYYNKLSTAFAGGQGPDLFLLSPSDFLRYANGDILVDLTPVLTEDVVADLYPDVMTTRKVNDKIYAIPMEVEPMAMFYDVKAFDDAGLTEADIPQTYDQLVDVAKKLTTKDRYGVLFETKPGGYQVFTWYPFLWSGGGDITTQDGKHSAFNTQGTVEALQLWKDLVDQGAAPREILGGGGFDIGANLGAGYCAIQNIGIWGIAGMKADAPDIDFGIFKCPAPTGGTPVSVAGGWAFVASTKGKNPDVAAQFIAWALASTEADSIQRMLDWCTVAKADMPPRKSVLAKANENGTYAEGPLKTFADEILPISRGEPRTPPEVWQVITDAIQACQLNGEDPGQVAKETSDKIDQFLATYQGARIL